MPALQQIYSAFTQLTFVGPALNKLYDDIRNLKTFNEKKKPSTLQFKKNIVLNNINFNYPNSSRTTLKNINLTIAKNSTVGFVGATGSGKTTTVDIILGLLEAQEGTLEVDEQIISENNIRSWQKIIGYVPQHIFLLDDTVTSNIAFGVVRKYLNRSS